MTIHEVSSQLYNLTSGRVNGEKFTKRQLESAIAVWMRGAEHNKIKYRHVIELELADGKWLATIDRFSDQADGFDYYIPDTRDQEAEILKQLTA